MRDAAPIPSWLTGLYPFAPQSFRTAGGARMSYLDEGPRGDEAVVMLHGNPTWSFYYRDLVRDLSLDIRCIAPDHVGMGLSEKPAGYDYRLASRIADVEALIGHLGLKRVHLVVHDWGGAIGLGWAVRHLEQMGRIVLLNTAAFPSARIPARIALCQVPGLGACLVRGLNGFARPATRMAMHARRLSADEKRGYLYPYGSWRDRVGINAFVRDIPMGPSHPSRAVLEDLAVKLSSLAAVPKAIVWGGRDFCFDDSFLQRWREIYPSAAVHRLAEAGHYVLEDGGAEARRLIAEFLLPGRPADAGGRFEQRFEEATRRLNQGRQPKSTDIRPLA